MDNQLQGPKVEVFKTKDGEEILSIKGSDGKFQVQPHTREAQRRRERFTHIRDLARPYTHKALATLISVMESETAKDNHRIRAAEVILAYAYGRPPQAIMDVDNENPLQKLPTGRLEALLLIKEKTEEVIDAEFTVKEDDEDGS